MSIRDRRQNVDVSGDPWHGRTLEWGISSPPPFYNFALVPTVHALDALWDMKERGEYAQPADHYLDIHMPKNTSAGFFIAFFAAIMGFALIWYIWWLAAVAVVAGFVTVWLRTSNDDIDYYVPGEEVARIEHAHFARVEQAANSNAMHKVALAGDD